MITTELRAELEKHKPKNYVKKVLERLEKLGHTNAKKDPYNPASIRSVYVAVEYRPGKFRENKAIQAAIIYVFKQQKKRNERREAAQKKIANTFK